jgi:hypothetical protein
MTLNIQLLIFSCILDLVLCSKELPFTTCTENHTQQKHRTEPLTSNSMYTIRKTILMCVLRSCSKLDAKRVAVSLTLHRHTYKHKSEVSFFLTCMDIHMRARAHTHTQIHKITVLHVLSFHLKLVTSQSGYHHRQSNYSSTLMFINIKKFGVITAMKV